MLFSQCTQKALSGRLAICAGVLSNSVLVLSALVAALVFVKTAFAAGALLFVIPELVTVFLLNTFFRLTALPDSLRTNIELTRKAQKLEKRWLPVVLESRL